MAVALLAIVPLLSALGHWVGTLAVPADMPVGALGAESAYPVPVIEIVAYRGPVRQGSLRQGAFGGCGLSSVLAFLGRFHGQRFSLFCERAVHLGVIHCVARGAPCVQRGGYMMEVLRVKTVIHLRPV